ncbi:MAG: hypothetical protein LBT00_14625 [Spirochaetaceae bacterium]|jgi:hypothetical protein|nr:hypothetical protein [Spirochaetaceae bacterium]
MHLFVSVRGRVVIARRRQLAVSDEAIQSRKAHPGLLRFARNDVAHQIHLFVSVRGRVVIARRRQLAVSDEAIQSRKAPTLDCFASLAMTRHIRYICSCWFVAESSLRGARRQSNPVKKGSHPGLLRFARNDEAHQIHLFVSVRGRVVIARSKATKQSS